MHERDHDPSRLRIWWLAARPKTLWAATAPVIVGTACAVRDGGFHLWAALAALVGALLIQIGTNLANDLHDFEKGTDTGERIGPLRVTQAGLIEPATMRRAIALVFALATAVGVYLIARGGWPILIFGSLSLVAAIAYTAGPFPIGYHGFGEVFVFLFFGLFAVVGTYWVQVVEAPMLVWLAAIPMGLLSSAILVVNNLRDIDGDRKAGKRTLAVRLGVRGAVAEYVGLILVAIVAPIVLRAVIELDAWILLPCATIVPAAVLVYHIRRPGNGNALNRALARTAQLQLLYVVAFSVGLLLS